MRISDWSSDVCSSDLQIQALEDELGVQLLVRTTKGVSLTAAGRSFLDDARVILTRSRDSRDRCRAAGRGDVGRLAIGYLGSVIYQVLPALLRIPGVREAAAEIGRAHV